MSETFCNNCGHRNPEGANFCSSCGQALERVAEEPSTITFTMENLSAGEEIQVDVADVGPGGVLVATRGPNSGSEFALEHVITTIGRHPDSDIFLDDVTVSRRHVEVERTGSTHVVRDLGSLNGTYVNRTLIDAAVPIENGDEVQVGRFRLVYVAGAEG